MSGSSRAIQGGPWLAILALFGGAIGVIGPATAQESEEDVSVQERVTVTGSRIRQVDVEGGSPVLVISREDIDKTGLTSVGDVIQRLTISGSALNTRFNSSGNFGFPPDGGGIGAGATQADLRNLGASRTLVLVDGIRWINGASASGVSNAVDLNTIPLNIIDRIEVLEDGASAIYGSDAIAGVINIITRKDVQGVDFSAYQGRWDDDDGITREYTLSFGNVTDDMSMFLSAGYVDQGRVTATSRSIAKFPKPGGTRNTHGSSGTPQGRFVGDDPNTGNFINCTINNLEDVVTYDPANPCSSSDSFHAWSNQDRFNFGKFNLVATPSERYNVYGQTTYNMTPNTQVYLRAMYNNRQSTNQAAPEPIFIGPEAGTGGFADTISVDVTNPYNPFGFTWDAATNDYF